MRLLIALIFVATAAATISQTDAQQADSDGLESLGNELLEGLTPDDLQQPARPSNRALNSDPQPPAPPSAVSSGPNGSPQPPRFDHLGEDIGQPSGSLSLARVHRGMQQAEMLLDRQRSNGETGALQAAAATQQQVIDQLDKLIAELSRQCQGGQCKPNDQPPKPSQQAQSKPGKSGAAASRGQTAARDSNTALNQAGGQPEAKDYEDIDMLVKDLWGHLPERSREQMLQSFSDEFLPQYELEIEQYYRRLSEQDETTQ